MRKAGGGGWTSACSGETWDVRVTSREDSAEDSLTFQFGKLVSQTGVDGGKMTVT